MIVVSDDCRIQEVHFTYTSVKKATGEPRMIMLTTTEKARVLP
jgi:hypothetical protein